MKPKPKNGVVKTSCGLCLTYCGMLVHLQDGKVVKIEGDPDSPNSKGVLCVRGLAAAERLYHPDRLKHPQKRLGERGEGKWQQISWDEALDTIADEMIKAKKDYGAESVSFMYGSAKGYNIESFVGRCANTFGTPNVGNAAHVCFQPTSFSAVLTCGANPAPDYEYPPACILLWGVNPFETFIIEVEPIRQALARGTKLIVVDPRKVGFANQADFWLQPRPGTDLALALGMINVIVNEELYDKAFVDKWTVGFDKLSKHVQDYPPQRVEEVTWVPADTIIKAARLYATSKPACIHSGNSLEHNINSFQAGRAISILRAITGNLGVPGGDLIRKPIPVVDRQAIALPDKRSKEQWEKRVGGRYVPMYSAVPFQSLVKAILEEKPYPIRVVYLCGANPLLTYSDAQAVYKALKKVHFFAASDMFMTPSAALADIVLPAASFLEFDSISSPNLVQIQQKVAQVGECWPDYKIFNELAKKVGIGQYFWDDADEFLDFVLKPCGITFEEFKKIGVIHEPKVYRTYEADGKFNTPSGKVEIYSDRLQKWGFDPLPTYRELPETPISDPELAKEYPLILTTCKVAPFRHSSDRYIHTLRGMQPEPLVEIHPKIAKKLGIKDGDWVYIENKRGRIKQKAVLTTGIDPRVVRVDYGWWFPEKGASELYGWAESNVNVLTDNEPPYNHEIGSNQLRGILCKVYKVS